MPEAHEIPEDAEVKADPEADDVADDEDDDIADELIMAFSSRTERLGAYADLIAALRSHAGESTYTGNVEPDHTVDDARDETLLAIFADIRRIASNQGGTF